jgi:hypothetical protein
MIQVYTYKCIGNENIVLTLIKKRHTYEKDLAGYVVTVIV